jgi:hypothetical protein
MAEYLLCKLKVEGSCPALLKTFPVHRWKISGALKTQQKIQAQMEKNVLLSLRIQSASPVWIAKINVTACNSVHWTDIPLLSL